MFGRCVRPCEIPPSQFASNQLADSLRKAGKSILKDLLAAPGWVIPSLTVISPAVVSLLYAISN